MQFLIRSWWLELHGDYFNSKVMTELNHPPSLLASSCWWAQGIAKDQISKPAKIDRDNISFASGGLSLCAQKHFGVLIT